MFIRSLPRIEFIVGERLDIGQSRLDVRSGGEWGGEQASSGGSTAMPLGIVLALVDQDSVAHCNDPESRFMENVRGFADFRKRVVRAVLTVT